MSLRSNVVWFEDFDFPPNSTSLNVNGTQDDTIVWKRASELTSDPKFIVDDISRQDLDQGQLGDCWYIASAASLASNYPEMLEKVIMPNQGFGIDQYSGQFCFTFWWYGKWEKVVIDDFLPTKMNQLHYCKCNETSNEFWPALLEKAYAKLHGCYESLDGGFEQEAMVDLTGGISDSLKLKAQIGDDSLYERLKRSFEMKTLMSASINIEKVHEERQVTGLITGHAYSITNFLEIDVDENDSETPVKYQLLRVRNPWGNDAEWKGKWSDDYIKKQPGTIRRQLGSTNRDGEFWISYVDFISKFDQMSLCYTNPNAWVTDGVKSSKDLNWKEIVVHGSFANGITTLYLEDESGNIQEDSKYPLDLQTFNMSPVIISVMKKDSSKSREKYIVFEIFQAKTDRRVYSGVGKNRRDVTRRFELPRGSYYVTVKTEDSSQSVNFCLRIFTVEPSTLYPLVTNVAPKPADNESINELFEKHCGSDNKMDVKEFYSFLLDHASFNLITQYPDVKISFNIEISRTLHALFDTDESTFLNIDEVLNGCKQIKKCLKVFRCFKQDNHSDVDASNLSEMFKALEIKISQKVFVALVRRYGGRHSEITVEDFIMSVCKLESLLKSYANYKEVNNSSLIEQMLADAILK